MEHGANLGKMSNNATKLLMKNTLVATRQEKRVIFVTLKRLLICEIAMNTVYKIKENMHGKYRGCGYALVASLNDEILDIVYLRDIIEDFDDEDFTDNHEEILTDNKMAPTIRYLSSLGNVSVGMCSCYEFIEL